VLPILILGYARVDTLKQTLASILNQPHGPIYVSCDGPSPAYAPECAEVRNYTTDLLRMGFIHNLRLSDVNEGTLSGVSKGIDWFFEQEEIGIIIEDDLVLEPRLLEAAEISSSYLSDINVMSIGLHNGVPAKFISENDKIFRRSNFVVSWGWVTTREEWSNRLRSFHDFNFWSLIMTMTKAIGVSSAAYHTWFYALQYIMEKKDVRKCNWDDLWQINCFLKKKTVAILNRNQITNIGYGKGATHTFGKSLYVKIVPITEAEFKSRDLWILPQEKDNRADTYFARDRRITNIVRAKAKMRTRLGLRSFL